MWNNEVDVIETFNVTKVKNRSEEKEKIVLKASISPHFKVQMNRIRVFLHASHQISFCTSSRNFDHRISGSFNIVDQLIRDHGIHMVQSY